MVLAPSLYLCREQTGANLSGYVWRGGQLLVSYFSGIVDEHDAVHAGGYPGPLREVLGLSVEEFLPFAADERAGLTGPLLDQQPERSDLPHGGVWADMIRLEGAEPAAIFVDGRAAGEPAITRNQSGFGSAWYVATNLDDATLDALLERVLGEAGIQAEQQPDGLERIVRLGREQHFEFLINHSADDVAITAEDGTPVVVPAHDVLVRETRCADPGTDTDHAFDRP